MKELGGDQEEVLSIEKFGGYKTEEKERVEARERQVLRNKVKEEEHLEIYGALRKYIGMKTYLHGPMDYANRLKPRFRAEDLDLPEIRRRYASSWEKEDVATHMCPCATTIESRTHIVGECERYKEERDALEDEVRKLDVCDMEEWGRLESSEKTIATLSETGQGWHKQTVSV